MTNRVFGPILDVDAEERLIKLYYNGKKQFFYMQRALYKKLNKYLVIGNYVDFIISPENKILKYKNIYRIEYFIKIKKTRYRQDEIYYDYSKIKESVRTLVNKKSNRMFIDLEMTLPDYKVKNTIAEIIQYGLVIEDSDKQIIMEDFDYIKPHLVKSLNNKTRDFLHISNNDLKDAISFQEFYKRVKYYIDEYNPIVYVWGRNDIIALKDAYKIYKLKPLIKRNKIIDLLKLQKTYFNLKNDLGLFNAYSMYYNEYAKYQAHDALEDALMTRKVFHKFNEIVYNDIDFNFPEGVI